MNGRLCFTEEKEILYLINKKYRIPCIGGFIWTDGLIEKILLSYLAIANMFRVAEARICADLHKASAVQIRYSRLK
jgi:hypothetical protein